MQGCGENQKALKAQLAGLWGGVCALSASWRRGQPSAVVRLGFSNQGKIREMMG